MTVYYILLNVTERFAKPPLKEMARTLLANKSFCGGGVLMANDITCKQIAQITDKGFNEMTGRVYDGKGLSPSIRTFCGGNQEVKILEEPIALDEQNRCIRQDGTVGTLTTDGSSPKHNNRVIEPCRGGAIYG